MYITCCTYPIVTAAAAAAAVGVVITTPKTVDSYKSHVSLKSPCSEGIRSPLFF